MPRARWRWLSLRLIWTASSVVRRARKALHQRRSNGQWIDIVNGKPIPPGELVIVIDLKSDKDWTFVLTAQSYAKTYDPSNTKDLYGAYNYRPDNDVAPPPMTVKRLPYSVDQLMWWFSDITPTGGTCGLRGNG